MCASTGAGQEAISWADLIVLAAKVAHVQSWTAQKVKRASIAQDGSTIAEAFGAAFPVPLGRVDATSPDAPVQVPTQTASPAEVKVSLNMQQTVCNRQVWLEMHKLCLLSYLKLLCICHANTIPSRC